MERPWLSNYPANVPAQVDYSRYPSVAALFEESFSKYRTDAAYTCMGKTLTYGDIDRHSRDLGAYLQGLGLKRGDRVALMMPNLLQFPIAVAAVMRAGLVVVNVNPLYTPRELEHQLNDSGALAIIILENFAATLQQVLERTPIRHVVLATAGDMLGLAKGALVNYVVRHKRKAVPAYSLPRAVGFRAALSGGKGKPLDKAALDQDDIAVLQYTGGTTGVSKGAVLLHRTIISNLLASEAWFQVGLKRRPISGQVTFICALPLYHVFAFITCSLLAMRLGGLCVLIPNPRDLPGSIKEMAKYRFHVFPAVNTLYNGLANNADFAKLDFDQLRVCVGGGMAVQEAVAKKWFAVTGVPIVEGYGLTETSSGIACNPCDNDAYTGSIGLPLPNVDLRLLDEEGRDVAPGEPGEIVIRGPQVMAGYWQRPEETAQSMTEDGFFKTGDVGVMDARGYTKIVDRKKDMILVSGFNVYPNEIEGVAALHPGVLEAACVGVPDKNSGEAVMLFVIRKDAALGKEELSRHMMENLTGYKKPRYIEFRDDLPRTNVGKILRRELRDEAARSLKATAGKA